MIFIYNINSIWVLTQEFALLSSYMATGYQIELEMETDSFTDDISPNP